ncbi:CPBP family intramembrane glutamic endopeptidase [Gimesia chilikensis]|uniref:CAAX amino terminal protease self-immunity n=1 Tax=Gimesia chilikensis TaxID=2605989 RepID=A0A517PPB4_9PLAN|nr:type II CAAX endopeptidase family protein [Gimesia chilikensis]QDT21210.1 CAAX amino terminal protease self- immunity [Gimesia chilikensis]
MVAPENSPSEDTNPERLSAHTAADSPIFESEDQESAQELDQFLDQALQTAQGEDAPRPHDGSSGNAAPPGPGLIESICWMFGVFGAHFLGIMLFLVCGVIYLIATSNISQDPDTFRKEIAQLVEGHPLEAAGVEQAVFVFIGLIAVGLRLGKRPLQKLNLQPFAFSTGFLLFICVLPLALMSGELYRIAFDAWSLVAKQIPILERFNEMQTMEIVKDMAANNSLWSLILVIAVFPAIGEELIFRGMIGRGLIARWGLVPGIVITSIMFGIVHAHPAHVIAVIPLGMFMHYVYYVTRSFWAPMLVHFMNNAFAVSMAKMATAIPESAASLGDETQPVHPLIVASAALFLAAVCVQLWKTRVKYMTPQGEEWTPGYPSTEQPPANSPVTMMREKAHPLLYAAGVFLFLIFLVSMAAFSPQQEAVTAQPEAMQLIAF